MLIIIMLVQCLLLVSLSTVQANNFHQYQQPNNFDEQLIIKTLQNGQISTHFKFRTFFRSNFSYPFGVNAGRHVDIFPLSLLRLFHQLDIQEFHFSLTKGYWKYHLWGLPPRDSCPNAHLWAWFTTYLNSQENWTKLTSTISGQYCASINLINPTVTVHPKLSYRPFITNRKSMMDNDDDHHHYVYLASLPQEPVCTENLTPFIKMLPCQRKKGLGSLLNAFTIFDSQFSSMSTDFRFTCSDILNCEETAGIELKHQIMVVFNAPRIWDGKYSWTLNSLFGHSLLSYCPLATTSRVYVDVESLRWINGSRLNVPPTRYINLEQDQHGKHTVSVTDHEHRVDNQSPKPTLRFAEYDLKALFQENNSNNNDNQTRSLNIGVQFPQTFNGKLPYKVNFDQVRVRRSSNGVGLSTGGIEVVIENNLPYEIEAIYLDSIPWYLRIYLHTLTIVTTSSQGGTKAHVTNQPLMLHYEPARDRIRPHLLEMHLRLASKSSTVIRFEFDHQFLRWTEFPPDPNHGLYINPATVTFLFPDRSAESQKSQRFLSLIFDWLKSDPNVANDDDWLNRRLEICQRKHPIRLHTTPLIVLMPTPDFSMPYNVICLVSTALSIAFGPIFNLTTRIVVLRNAADKAKSTEEEPTTVKRGWFGGWF